jgi:hypothetical protein|tara:strand:+ start:40 stop:342 length:303 start_codon:yes stop_codon:yes gene_type:complete
MSDKPKNIQEYYEYYLTLHQNRINRRLHVLGQVATIAFILLTFKTNPWFLILAPFIVYPFAWSGHYFFEKNKPAAFSNPIWAKVCDWMMLRDIVLKRIEW